MELQKAISTRRTHKEFDGTAIPSQTIRQLLATAIKAPNHRRNWPWHIVEVGSQQIPHLLELLSPLAQSVWAPKGEEVAKRKWELTQSRLSRVGAMLYITSDKHPDSLIERENYAACCCLIQNLMLLATEVGLGSFWNTGALFRSSQAMNILKRDPNQELFVGSLWLGHPTQSPPSPLHSLEGKLTSWNHD